MAEEQLFRARGYLEVGGRLIREWSPPYLKFKSIEQISDEIESWLEQKGIPGRSFADIYFNGQKEIHTSIYLLADRSFGVWNHQNAEWPIHYLGTDPFSADPFGRDMSRQWEAAEKAEKKETSEDGDSMKVEAEEPEDGSDEPEEAADTESQGESEDYPDEDDEEDDEDADTEQDGENGEGDEDSDDDGNQDEEEKDVPRLKFFGKMRGPKGWRKRAETDPSRPANAMEFVFGVLDAKEGWSTARQERNKLVRVRFFESDAQRTEATMQINLPQSAEITESKGKLLITFPTQEDESE